MKYGVLLEELPLSLATTTAMMDALPLAEELAQD